MQNFQLPTKFLADMGHLLTEQIDHVPPAQQRQALANLGEYLHTARRHQGLTWAALAQQTDKSEVEIYALEHGLLPYSQIDFPLLCQLATALGEEVETLTLLMGRAAVALPPQSAPCMDAHLGLHHRTSSQRLDNWLATLPGTDPLHKQCLNLVDSLQKGRLFSYTRVNDGISHWIEGTAVLLACLLLLWVSTYSLSSLLHAQSYARLPVQTSARHPNASTDRSLDRSSTTVGIAGSVNQGSIAHLSRPTRPMGKAVADPVDEEQSTPISLFLPPTPADSQQCDLRIMGRFTLCRV